MRASWLTFLLSLAVAACGAPAAGGGGTDGTASNVPPGTGAQMVRLYAALANNGELRSLRFTRTAADHHGEHHANLTALSSQVSLGELARNARQENGKQILSPEAAFLTLEMLGNVPRPEMNCADGNHSARVYWKTGTSHGFRDAWSIAVFDHYVLGVWVGNFDGRANPAFVGRTAAAPLLFQIIDSLRAAWPEPTVPHQPPPGANLKRVEFCALSGDLPNRFCTQHVEGWFIPGVSPIKTCDVHREVLVDVATRPARSHRRRHTPAKTRSLRILARRFSHAVRASRNSTQSSASLPAGHWQRAGESGRDRNR